MLPTFESHFGIGVPRIKSVGYMHDEILDTDRSGNSVHVVRMQFLPLTLLIWQFSSDIFLKSKIEII